MGDRAGLYQRCELFCPRPAGGIDITAESVDGVVGERDGFVFSLLGDHGQNGSENFFFPDAHAWLYPDDQRGFVIGALKAGRFASADHDSRTLRARIFDLGFQKLDLTLSHERAKLCVLLQRITYPTSLYVTGELLHGFIEARYVNNETLEAAADLAVVAEFGVEDLRHRFIDIRILTDDAASEPPSSRCTGMNFSAPIL